jgi:uncharacterized MAPEG superfamily protein
MAMSEVGLVLVYLSLLTIVLVAVQGVLTPLAHGFAYGLGNRDEFKDPTVFMRRMDRVMNNHLQSLAMSVPLLTVLFAAPVTSVPLAVNGAWVFLLGRIAFTVAYLIGIPVLRSALWGVGVIGVVMMLVGIFQS